MIRSTKIKRARLNKKGPDENQALPKLTIKKTHLNFADSKVGRMNLLSVNHKLMILNSFDSRVRY